MSEPLPVLFMPAETGRQQASAHWFRTTRRDPLAVALYRRHYTCKRPKATHRTSGFAGPGESITLLTADADALFLWKYECFRLDSQSGVECSVFRNEGKVLSSLLIREAVEIAERKWPATRLFTFVNAAKVRSDNPGYCFLMAGWKRVGVSSRGLIVLEYREGVIAK